MHSLRLRLHRVKTVLFSLLILRYITAGPGRWWGLSIVDPEIWTVKNGSDKADNDHHENKKTTYTSVQSADRSRAIQGRSDASSNRLKARRSSRSDAAMEKEKEPP